MKDEIIVRKPASLVRMKMNPFGLNEMKMTDLYLFLSNNQSTDEVWISLVELSELFGVDRVYLRDIDRMTDNLMTPVTVLTDNGEWIKVVLFSKATIKKEGKTLVLGLRASPESKGIMKILRGIQYYKYPLLKEIKKKHDYELFMYFVKNKYKGKWSITAADLKRELYISDYEYVEFRRFNEKIVQPGIKRLNEYMPDSIKCKTVGARTGAPCFHFEVLKTKKTEEEESIIEVSENMGFTRLEWRDLRYVAASKIKDATEAQIDEYLTEQVAKMDQKKPGNRYRYLRKMIENDIEERGSETKNAIDKRHKRSGIIFQASMRDYEIPPMKDYEIPHTLYEDDEGNLLPEDFWKLGADLHVNEKYLEEGNPYREVALKYQERKGL